MAVRIAGTESQLSLMERGGKVFGFYGSSDPDKLMAVVALVFQISSAYTTSAGIYEFLPVQFFALTLGIGMQVILLVTAERLRAMLSAAGEAEYKRLTLLALTTALSVSWFFSSTEFFRHDGYHDILGQAEAQTMRATLQQARFIFEANRKLALDAVSHQLEDLRQKRSAKREITKNAVRPQHTRQAASAAVSALSEEMESLREQAASLTALTFPTEDEYRHQQVTAWRSQALPLSRQQVAQMRWQLIEAQRRQAQLTALASPEAIKDTQLLPQASVYLSQGVTAVFVREFMALRVEALKPALFGFLQDGFTLLLVFIRISGGVRAVIEEVRLMRRARLQQVRSSLTRATSSSLVLTFIIRQPVADCLQVAFAQAAHQMLGAVVIEAFPQLSQILSNLHGHPVKVWRAYNQHGAELEPGRLLNQQLDESMRIYLNDPPATEAELTYSI